MPIQSRGYVHSLDDRVHVIEYVKGHIRAELNLETQVHAVSAMPVGRDLLTQWFENDIAPLYNQQQELKLRSIRRKVGTLHQSVEASLRAPAIQGARTRYRRRTAS
jgi:hypothetical protein